MPAQSSLIGGQSNFTGQNIESNTDLQNENSRSSKGVEESQNTNKVRRGKTKGSKNLISSTDPNDGKTSKQLQKQ